MGDARLSSSPHITNITVASSGRTAAVPFSASPPNAQQNSSTSRRTLEPKATPNSTDTLQLQRGPLSVHRDGSESPLEEELHGPGSYLSICSHPAAEWVSEQIGNSGFTDSATSLTNTVYRDLKMQIPVHHGQMPEPDLACAMSYAEGAEPFESRGPGIYTANQTIFSIF
ncbi:hypothetical protein DL95DRAFT_468204 [Leptodontidium sp. 2 PMI_412]|nr:hypothetical protein DL95DRAFT_468204 [Leptodontidium sp. 2 PMI_412]